MEVTIEGSRTGAGAAGGNQHDSSTDAGARSLGRRLVLHPVAVAIWVLFLAALALGAVLAPDEAAVRAALRSLGPLAPLAFVLLELVQVVVIPIPAQPFEIPAGWFFGLGWGSVLASAGAFAGSVIAFGLGRRFGRPWVEARIAPQARRRFEERWTKLPAGATPDDGAAWIIFWLMMVPAFPRDPLCYLAGVTRLSTPRFLLIAAVGRPVGLVPWVALGADGVAAGVELQLLMIGAAGVVWFIHLGYRRWRGAAPDEGQAPEIQGAEPKENRNA